MQIGFLSKVDVNVEAMRTQFAPEPLQVFQSQEELAGAIGDLDVLIAMNQGFPRFAIDAEVQGFPFDPTTGGSGVNNFTYANILNPTNRDTRRFLEIHPFSRLAVIVYLSARACRLSEYTFR